LVYTEKWTFTWDIILATIGGTLQFWIGAGARTGDLIVHDPKFDHIIIIQGEKLIVLNLNCDLLGKSSKYTNKSPRVLCRLFTGPCSPMNMSIHSEKSDVF
jgi:hypothetical protein